MTLDDFDRARRASAAAKLAKWRAANPPRPSATAPDRPRVFGSFAEWAASLEPEPADEERAAIQAEAQPGPRFQTEETTTTGDGFAWRGCPAASARRERIQAATADYLRRNARDE